MDSIFKQTLRAELDFQDIKIKELSSRTGISPRTLEGYLSARGSIPPADVAVKIAQTLHVSVEYLVTGNADNNGKYPPPFTKIEEKIAALPSEKKHLLKEFIALLDGFDVVQHAE